MKILHAPLNIANDGFSLVMGLRELGHDAQLATISNNILVEPGTIDLTFFQDSSISRQINKLRFVRDVLPTFDVVHFHGGRSILDYGQGGMFSLIDVKAAHDNGQVVAATFHGCEVRDLQEGGCPWPCRNPVCKEGNKRKRFEKMQKYLDLTYVTTPDLLPAVPCAELLPQSVWALNDLKPIPPLIDVPLKVVHVPSSRATKGTDAIEDVMAELIREGYQFDFKVVENVSHAKALEAMSEADVVIDHVQIGWYCVVSVEAAAMGKPVVVRFDENYVNLSGLERPPFISATKESLKAQMIELYQNRNSLIDFGRQNREFVLKRHGAISNAQRLVADYEKIMKIKRIQGE